MDGNSSRVFSGGALQKYSGRASAIGNQVEAAAFGAGHKVLVVFVCSFPSFLCLRATGREDVGLLGKRIKVMDVGE